MKKLLICISLLTASLTFAQKNDAHFQDAVKLMKMSNATIESSLKPYYSQIPEDNVAEFKKDLEPLLDEMYHKMAKVAVKQYTHENIKDMLAFYETELGKTMLEGQVKVFQASVQIGQEFSMQLMPLIQKHMMGK